MYRRAMDVQGRKCATRDNIYLCCGPWLVGDLIDGRFGVLFAWGTIFEDGMFLKGTTTYFYCGLHIILFNWPLIGILAHTADVR